jgi:hypothetical protein
MNRILAIAVGLSGGLFVSDVGHAQFGPQIKTGAIQNMARGKPGIGLKRPITAIQKGGSRLDSSRF